MKKKIVLLGGGGHCKVVIDAIKCGKKYDIYGIVDPKLKKGEKVLGVPVVGSDSELKDIFKKGIKDALITVGSVGDPTVRKKLHSLAKSIGFDFPTVVHPKAVVADDVKIGKGTFVAASVTINSGTSIGDNAIINTSSSIDHDCVIGDFVHVAPGAVLSGGVKVGRDTHIGTGANVVHSVSIKEKSFIKAGSLVAR